MSYADAIRRQAEDAPRAALPAVTKALWTAFTAGQVTEAEAESIAALVEIRLTPATDRAGSTRNGSGQTANGGTEGVQDRQNKPRRASVGSRPRTDASMERRRRWAASGRLPPGLAARFTLAEQSVLALVAAETARRGDCRLAVPHLAAIAGVAETTVRNAIREAKKLGLVTVEERRVTGFRNLPNIVRIVSPEWTAWLRMARKGMAMVAIPRGRDAPSPSQGGGCKSPNRTPTQVLDLYESWTAEPLKELPRAAGGLDQSEPSRIRSGGGTGRAMR